MTLSTSIAAHATEAPVDGWVQLLPAGQFQGRDGRGPYRLDNADAVIAATRALGMDLPIDRDHQTDFAPRGTAIVAAGWIRELSARSDGLYGRVEWTDTAKAQLAAREYRYLSPVFDFVRESGRVVRVLRAALTNNPNLHLTAIASQERREMQIDIAKLRQALGLGEDSSADAIVTAAQTANAAGTAIGDVRSALGLPATADTAAMVARVRELAAAADPARVVPLAQFEGLSRELAAVKQRLVDADVERAVHGATAEGKLAPAMHDWARAYAAKDLDGFKAWAASAPVIVKPGAADPARAPGGDRTMDDEDRAVASALGLSAEAWSKTLKQETR